MRFLFAVTLTSLVLFESIEVATPGHTTSAQGVRSNRERGAYCEAASVRQDPLASGALACRAGSPSRPFDDGIAAVAD